MAKVFRASAVTALMILSVIELVGCASINQNRFSLVYVASPPASCPDQQPAYSAPPKSSGGSDAKTDPAPTVSPKFDSLGLAPCAASVIKGAIDYCVTNTLGFGTFDQIGDLIVSGGTFTAAAATGIAAAAGASGGVLAAVGVGTLLLTNASSGLSKILPTSPPTANVQNMINAGVQYLQLSPSPPSNNLNSARPYYADLWNAIGSACPAGMFHAYVPDAGPSS